MVVHVENCHDLSGGNNPEREVTIPLPLQAQGVMWALKGSLAKEPLMTEAFLASCMAALKPVQIAQLIVAYFPRTVWPDLVALCSAVVPRNGSIAANGVHA